MRIVAMSDTHLLHHKLVVPDGDVLVHCGDFSGKNDVEEYAAFFAWMSALPHEHKVLIAGNHESLLDDFNRTVRKLIPDSITYLQDSGATIEGLKFWGSPRTPSFPWMAFAHFADEVPEARWSMIPSDVDVLVTHGPPYGILDRNYAGRRIGDPDLMQRVKQVRPRLHLFGHVHDQNGRMQRSGTTFVNAAIGDDDEDPNLSDRVQVIVL